jgi:hypothetical protein
MAEEVPPKTEVADIKPVIESAAAPKPVIESAAAPKLVTPVAAAPIVALKVEQFDFVADNGKGTLQAVSVSTTATPQSQYGPAGRVANFGNKPVAPPGRATRHEHRSAGTQTVKTPPVLSSSVVSSQVLATEHPEIVLRPMTATSVLTDLGLAEK